MNNFFKSSLMGGALLLGLTGFNAYGFDGQDYPKTKEGAVVETLHGVKVADPYRWLEDDIRENKEVQNWVYDQNIVTHSYLDTLEDRAAIAARMTELWNYAKFSTPKKSGERYFYSYNSGLQNQNILYMQDGLEGARKAVIDPNNWAVDGTTALADYEPSPSGQYILYAVQDGGSDWRTLHILDVETGEILEDTIEWAKFTTLTWAKDSKGFYYSGFPAPEEGMEMQSLNINQAVNYHALGTSQDQDKTIFQRLDFPKEGASASLSDDGKYLVITITDRATGPGNGIHILNLEDPLAKPEPLIPSVEFHNVYIGSLGDTFYFNTNNDAQMNRIVAVNSGNKGSDNWKTIVGEREHAIRGANLVGGKLLVSYMEDVKSAVHAFDLEGRQVSTISLPGIGSANGFGGNSEDTETFYTFSSYNLPPTVFHYDVEQGTSSVFMKAEMDFDPASIEVRQVFYPSKDGTKIPMFIMHKKDMDFSEAKATILYGYGGFNIPITPSFSPVTLTWLEMGGVYAVANLRGGSEYGTDWHEAGMRLNKQNVFDDFISGAEYLISEGITSSDKLSVYGHSNGGLLVGAVVNQRPELFAAGLAGAGVMDMLRFNQFTAGRYWVNDYGSPDNEADFKNLLNFSPYHNVKDGVEYPPVFVTAADMDDRVVPGHSFKYAARLQAADIGDEPHLIRIETRAGHGAGMPTEKRIAVYVDYWAFAAKHSGLKLPKDFTTKDLIN